MDLKEEKQYYINDESNPPEGINDKGFFEVNLDSNDNDNNFQNLSDREAYKILTGSDMAGGEHTKSFQNKGYNPDENLDNVKANNIPKSADDKQNTHAAILDVSRTGVKNEKRSIFKNVLVICFAFMLLFTAFSSMSALQSSINKV